MDKDGGINQFQLRFTVDSLCKTVEVYDRILSGHIQVTVELKNAIQKSIKEFCTAICDLIR